MSARVRLRFPVRRGKGRTDFREAVKDINNIVFEKGTYQVPTKYGTATVVIPEDITLDQIEPEIKSLALAYSERITNEQ